VTLLARFAGFAAALAAVFGAALVVGGLVGPRPSAAEADAAHGGDMAGEGDHAMAAQTVRGLAVTDGGYTLALADRRLPARSDTQLRFRILDSDGAPLRRYAVEHEKRMHLIVVRRDASGLQHLHPTLAADGTWRASIRFRDAGAYRVFADFKTGDTPRTLGADLTVDGPATYRELPEPAAVADAGDGLTVRLDAPRSRAARMEMLSFTVMRDGRPLHTQPYLGAGGHLVALRDGDLAFLHVHPAEHGERGDAIPFETEFASAGRYRLYLQFRVDGKVHTAAFTRAVTR
jgi:hypothetical protein